MMPTDHEHPLPDPAHPQKVGARVHVVTDPACRYSLRGKVCPVCVPPAAPVSSGEAEPDHELMPYPTGNGPVSPENDDRVMCICGDWSGDGNDPKTEAEFAAHVRSSSGAAAFDRLGSVDPEEANAVAHAVTDVLGFVPLDERYAVAVLALESLHSLRGEASGSSRSSLFSPHESGE